MMMPKSKVILIRGTKVLDMEGAARTAGIEDMFRRGLTGLEIGRTIEECTGRLFDTSHKVGIKINTIGGRMMSTRPETALALASVLGRGRLSPERIIIWDRTNAELKSAGYRLSVGRDGPVVCGTDTRGLGYEKELRAHLNVGSLFSTIQTREIGGSVSLAVLKDHGLAGVTGGLKNYFGVLHNPNKYHDNGCDPFVAEVFDSPPIRQKHKLTILDALVVQFHRGPSFHARWAAKEETLVFSLDPVAADSIGRRIIDGLRSSNGLPSLEEDDREPRYLNTAQSMGLGRADPADIDVVELSI